MGWSVGVDVLGDGGSVSSRGQCRESEWFCELVEAGVSVFWIGERVLTLLWIFRSEVDEGRFWRLWRGWKR